MKNLWAPWRMSYVKGEAGRDPGCIFEVGAEQPGLSHDKDSLLLFRDQLTVVLLNRFPYANGHLLIAPVRHVADLEELNDQEALALMKMVRHGVAILRKYLAPDGLNVGLNLGAVAGAGLADHLHFHIVPRWEGDHNFMTVLAEVRTIPEHLEKTFELLQPEFAALGQEK